MSNKRFKRTTEDFTCEHCGRFIRGNGYTNHCPNCLWSKHVDVNPGDRAACCQGMMRPIELQQKQGSFVILHRCERCGYEKRNKTADADNTDRIIELSSR